MHFWKSEHTITTGDMTIAPLWQEKLMFCLIKTVIISHSPVTSVLLIWNLNICLQIVLVTWNGCDLPTVLAFPSQQPPQRERRLAVEHRPWESVIHRSTRYGVGARFCHVWNERWREVHGHLRWEKWGSDLLEPPGTAPFSVALEPEGSGFDSGLCQLLVTWPGQLLNLLRPPAFSSVKGSYCRHQMRLCMWESFGY